MVEIALAGATSGIGLAIRQALDAQNKHDYVVLIRTPNVNEKKAIVVNYTSPEDLANALSTHSIQTVISCLSIGDEASGVAQLNLIEASNKTDCVKCFLPSEFGADYNENNMRLVPSYAYKIQARELLARSSLEHSIISIGMFLDYWSRNYLTSVLDPAKGAGIFIDLAHNFAAIPGDGNTPMVFTHSAAAAQFVLAVLDLSMWPRECFFAGDRLSLNEFLDLARKAKDAEFEVIYDSLENAEAGEVTVTPGLRKWMPTEYCKPFVKTISISYLTSSFDLPVGKCRNDLLADVSYPRVEDLLKAIQASR